MRRKLILLCALFLGLSAPAFAQVTATGTITTNGAATCVTTGSCVRLAGLPGNSGAVSVQITNTWTGTLSLEMVADASTTNYVTAQGCRSANSTVTTMTANGVVQCNVAGMTGFQVRGSAAMTGTATIRITSSVATAGTPASGGGGGVNSVSGTSPIVATGTTAVAVSCPTCSTASGTVNRLSKFTSSTNLGDSGVLEDLTADTLYIRLGAAGVGDEEGTLYLTSDSTGDTTPAAFNQILFATKDGAGGDDAFSNILASVTSTSAMDPLNIHDFKIGNGDNDDRLLHYTFNETTDAETLSLADDAIVYGSSSSPTAYQLFLNWNTTLPANGGFKAYGIKTGDTASTPILLSQQEYFGGTPFDKGGVLILNAGGNAIDPVPNPAVNSNYNSTRCIGYGSGNGDLCGLLVWNGDARISNPTNSYVQILSEPDFTTTLKWSASGDFSFTGGKAVYGGGGSSAITQTQADLVSPALANRYYSFSYTTSSVTGTPVCVLQSPGWDSYIGNPHSLDLTAGAHIVDGTVGPAFYFRTAASAPTDFVLTCDDAGTVSFDTLFLSLSAGGDLIVDGNFTVNGNCTGCGGGGSISLTEHQICFGNAMDQACDGDAGFTFDSSLSLFQITGSSMPAGGGNVAVIGTPGGNTYMLQVNGPDGSFANNSATMAVTAVESDPVASGFVRALSVSAAATPLAGVFSVVRGIDVSASPNVAAGATVTDATALLVQSVPQGLGTTVTARGIKVEIGGASVPTNAIAIQTSDLGDLVFGALKTTGAATGKSVVCVDTATGKLYASSSGVACAN